MTSDFLQELCFSSAEKNREYLSSALRSAAAPGPVALLQNLVQLVNQLHELLGVLFLGGLLAQNLPVFFRLVFHVLPPGRIDQNADSVGLTLCRRFVNRFPDPPRGLLRCFLDRQLFDRF